MTYRQDYETPFYVVILSKHHHHHQGLYGTLHLLLCLLRNERVRSEIEPFFTRGFAISLVDNLLDLLNTYRKASNISFLTTAPFTGTILFNCIKSSTVNAYYAPHLN
jgi:hypothetical protein